MKRSFGWLTILFITGIAFADPVTRLYISLKHQIQETNLCVPTSASMVIEYYGDKLSPKYLKSIAIGHPNFQGTYFMDLADGLKKLGYFWEIRLLDVDTLEFQASIQLIEEEIINHHPPLVDITPNDIMGTYGVGHTMPIVGFDNESKEIIFHDPGHLTEYIRRMTFKDFQKCWHAQNDRKLRAIMLTRPKGDSTFVSSR